MSRPSSKEVVRQTSTNHFSSSSNNNAFNSNFNNSSSASSFATASTRRLLGQQSTATTTTISTSSVSASATTSLPPLISNYLPNTRRYSHTSIDLNSDATELSNYRENRVVTPVADDTFEGDKVGRKVTLGDYENNNNDEGKNTNNTNSNNQTDSSPTDHHQKQRIHLLSEFSAKINEALSVTARALNIDERRKMLDSRDSANSRSSNKKRTSPTPRYQLPQTARSTTTTKQKQQEQQQLQGKPPKASSSSTTTKSKTARGEVSNAGGSVIHQNNNDITGAPSSSSSSSSVVVGSSCSSSQQQSRTSSQNSSRISSANSRTSSERNALREEDQLLRLSRQDKQNYYENLKREIALQQKQQAAKKASRLLALTGQQQDSSTLTSSQLLNNSQNNGNLSLQQQQQLSQRKSSPPADCASLLTTEYERDRIKELTKDRITKQKDYLHDMLTKFQDTMKLNTGLAALEHHNNNTSRSSSPSSTSHQQGSMANNNINSDNVSSSARTEADKAMQNLSSPDLLLPEQEARIRREEETKNKLTNELREIIVSGRESVKDADRRRKSMSMSMSGGKIRGSLVADVRVKSETISKKSPRSTSSTSGKGGTSARATGTTSPAATKFGETFLSDKFLAGSGGQKAHREVREKLRKRREELEAVEPDTRVKLAKDYVDSIDHLEEIKNEKKRKAAEAIQEKKKRRLEQQNNNNNINENDDDDDEPNDENNKNNRSGDLVDPNDATFLTAANNLNNNNSKKKQHQQQKTVSIDPVVEKKMASTLTFEESMYFESSTKREIHEKQSLLDRLKNLRDEKNQPLFLTLVPQQRGNGTEDGQVQFVSKRSQEHLLARERRREEDRNGPNKVTEVFARTKYSTRGEAEAEEVRKRKFALMKERTEKINDQLKSKEQNATFTGAHAHTVAKVFSTWIIVASAARRWSNAIAERWQPFDGQKRAEAAFHPPYSEQRLQELADASQMIQRHMLRYRVRSYFEQRGEAAHNILRAMRHVVKHMRWRWAVHQFLARVKVVDVTMYKRCLRRRGRLILWQQQWKRIEPMVLRLATLYRDNEVRTVLGKSAFEALMKDCVPVISSSAVTERGSPTTRQKLRELKKLEEVRDGALITPVVSLLQAMINSALHAITGSDTSPSSQQSHQDINTQLTSASIVRLVPTEIEKVKDTIRQMWLHHCDQLRRECAWYFQNRKTQMALQNALKNNKSVRQAAAATTRGGHATNNINNMNSAASLSNTMTMGSIPASMSHASFDLQQQTSFVPVHPNAARRPEDDVFGSTNNNNNNNGGGVDKDFPILPLFLPFEEVVSRIVDMQKDWCLFNVGRAAQQQQNQQSSGNFDGSQSLSNISMNLGSSSSPASSPGSATKNKTNQNNQNGETAAATMLDTTQTGAPLFGGVGTSFEESMTFQPQLQQTNAPNDFISTLIGDDQQSPSPQDQQQQQQYLMAKDSPSPKLFGSARDRASFRAGIHTLQHQTNQNNQNNQHSNTGGTNSGRLTRVQSIVGSTINSNNNGLDDTTTGTGTIKRRQSFVGGSSLLTSSGAPGSNIRRPSFVAK